MNKLLRVVLSEEERMLLDKYLVNYPHGQISYILRKAVREFIKAEMEREELLKKSEGGKSGSQNGKGDRTKKAQADNYWGSTR